MTNNPLYCAYHKYIGHPIEDCIAFKFNLDPDAISPDYHAVNVVTMETRSSPRQGGEEDRRSWVPQEQVKGQLAHMMLKEPQTISMEMPRIAQGETWTTVQHRR